MNLKAGQWVKCVNSEDPNFTLNKYYQLNTEIYLNVQQDGSFIPEKKLAVYPNYDINIPKSDSSKFFFLDSDYFDLNNPLDYNPDDVV